MSSCQLHLFFLPLLLLLPDPIAPQGQVGESSYNIYGQFLPYQSTVDATTLRKNCFDGFRQRRCKVRESYREQVGTGFMQYETAGLNSLDDENADNKYFCLTCCSNSRPSLDILEVVSYLCNLSHCHF